jgi:DnaJ-class molecular chaperone
MTCVVKELHNDEPSLSDFELVKIHHPDSALARGVPEKVAQGRFQLLTSAYERLQNPLSHGSSTQRQQDKDFYDEIMRRRSMYRGMGVRDMEFRRTATTAEGTASSLWQRDEGLLFIFAILVRV